MTRAPSSVCELYRCRWGIEVFLKQIKQTFKVCDFIGHSKHAIRWQLWAASAFSIWQTSMGQHGLNRLTCRVSPRSSVGQHPANINRQSALFLRLALSVQPLWDDCDFFYFFCGSYLKYRMSQHGSVSPKNLTVFHFSSTSQNAATI